jgi:hypothetical protein
MPVNHLTTYTLDELKAIRDGWLQEGLDSHTIEDARLIARYLGKPFIVDHWTSNNWAWKYGSVEVALYEFVSHHYPAKLILSPVNPGVEVDGWAIVTTLVVKVDGQVHCRYKICSDPNAIQGKDWEDAVFIPGAWMDTIEQFVEPATREYAKQQEEHDTIAIKQLKTMLLLD